MLKLRHDSRGIAAVAIIVVIVVIAAVGGVGYYVMQNKDKQANLDNSPEAVAARSECEQAINDEDFCKFASNFSSLTEYKASLTTTGPDGNGVIDMEVDANGNSSMVIRDGNQEQSAIIYLDKASYIKDYTTNSWTKYTSTSTDDAVADLNEDIKIDFDQADVPEEQRVKYNKVGEEACDSFSCLKYEIIDPAEAGSQQFIWFDTKEYKLRRWSFTEGGNATDMVISYGSVTITAPSPVNEIPTNVDGPSEEELQQLMEQYTQ